MSTKIRLLTSYVAEGMGAAVIMGTGDVLAQTAVEKKQFKDIDLIRTIKYGSLGMLFVGPVLKYWYTLLDRLIRKNQGAKGPLKKMLVDQVIMAPPLTLSVITLVGLLNHEKSETIVERFKTQFPDIIKTNYLIWPAVQIINFGLVPLRYQVVFVQSVAVFWNCFVSQILNDKKTPEVLDKQKLKVCVICRERVCDDV